MLQRQQYVGRPPQVEELIDALPSRRGGYGFDAVLQPRFPLPETPEEMIFITRRQSSAISELSRRISDEPKRSRRRIR